MKGRWLINSFLLLLVLALAGLIRSELNAERIRPRLTDLTASDLYRIEIAREGEPPIQLTHSRLGWRMEAPLQVDANNEKVGQLLAILGTSVHRSFPQEGAAMSELELSPPKLKLRLDDLALGFGGIDPLGQWRYVAAQGLVHLIDDRFYHLLIAPPIDYVSPDLLPRGFDPVFGRLDAIPLAAETLTKLTRLRAERVERMLDPPGDASVELKRADGTALGFLVSKDRRRWGRPDQRLLYVLTDAPGLIEDPTMLDPTPPAPQPQPMSPLPVVRDLGTESVPSPFDEPFASAPDAHEPRLPATDPNRLVPGDAPLGAPPVVRLTPDGRAEPEVARPPTRLRGEPDKAAPYGFGQDPFAPDPPASSDQDTATAPR